MKPRQLQAILFDLDDTLYEERHFFRSGFVCVARELERRGVGLAASLADRLEHFHHHEGREQVFQKLAAHAGFSPAWIPELVALFRSHVPEIQLAPDSREALPRLRGRYRLGCVTDGWKDVQRRKVAALKVEPLLHALVIADELGREFWKPHPQPFLTCCARLGVAPEAAVFVGDNPERDLVGAQRAGLTFVRMRRPGAYFSQRELDSRETQSAGEVRQLVELEELLADWP